MLCQPVACGCSFQSAGLVISGSGEPGNPLTIEPAGPGIVADQDDVTSPFLGQTIYETTTERLKVYDGTDWTIYAGRWPRFHYTATLNQAYTSGTSLTTIGIGGTPGGAIVDTDGFYTASVNNLTVPAGLGGVYIAGLRTTWETDSAGSRHNELTVASNTGGLSPGANARVNAAPGGISTIMGAFTTQFLLIPGATITPQAWQNSGSSIDLLGLNMFLYMVEHRPDL